MSDRLTSAWMKSISSVHRAVLALTKGRVGSSFRDIPVVELHTIGRTSGKRRSVMLISPVQVGDTVVLVASRGGDQRHPDWYHNLVASPEVELTIGGTTRAVTARTATDAERAELWPRVVSAYPGYGEYQKRTTRDIPLVLCAPRRTV